MLFPGINQSNNEFDVIICGGGLAGQTLARQLKLNFPDISIAIIEKTIFPLPAAACKVGESTVEIGAFYFTDTLRLKDYFKNDHLVKLGLRYFFGDSQKCISERPEIGLSSFAAYDSVQIDRGLFENDLVRMNKRAGVTIIEGSSVQDIIISEVGQLHEVIYKTMNDGTIHTIRCRWVVDAMSRKSFLQRKFNLKIDLKENCSAAWFRVKGRFDYGDTVPEEKLDWHQRVPNRIRFYSTTHMMGKGYWVWVIPLSSGNTSVGIVTSEQIHPCLSYNSKEKAMNWLQKHEPKIFEHLKQFDFLDFLSMKNYGHTSKQIYSINRWACTGEAALFSDPFYSPGSNVIGFGNSCITKMIEEDFKGTLTKEKVDYFSDYIISYNDSLIETTHKAYPYFGDTQVAALNYLWDLCVGWSLIVPQMFNGIYLDMDKNKEIRKLTSRFYAISMSVKSLFAEWEKRSTGSFTYEFIDYLTIPFIKEIYARNLQKGKSFEALKEDCKMNMNVLSEMAQTIFMLAIKDTMPEKLTQFPEPFHVNPAAISLFPDRWESDGLFQLDGNQKEHSEEISSQLQQVFTFKNEVNSSAKEKFSFQW